MSNLEEINTRFTRSVETTRAIREGAAKQLKVKARGLELHRVYLDGLKLKDADFSFTAGGPLYWRLGEAVGVSFEGARLWTPFFTRSVFRRCNFRGAVLPFLHGWFGHFYRCDFTGADLSLADFTGATLEKCNFSDVRFNETKLNDAKIISCKGIYL